MQEGIYFTRTDIMFYYTSVVLNINFVLYEFLIQYLIEHCSPIYIELLALYVSTLISWYFRYFINLLHYKVLQIFHDGPPIV